MLGDAKEPEVTLIPACSIRPEQRASEHHLPETTFTRIPHPTLFETLGIVDIAHFIPMGVCASCLGLNRHRPEYEVCDPQLSFTHQVNTDKSIKISLPSDNVFSVVHLPITSTVAPKSIMVLGRKTQDSSSVKGMP